MRLRADILFTGAAQVVSPVDRGVPLTGEDLGRLEVHHRAAIAVRGGRIVGIGPPARFRARREVRLRGGTVTPGLVDPHTHVVYCGDRLDEFELRARGMSYREIARRGGGILSTVRATRAAGLSRLVRESYPRIRRMLRAGTTTAEVKSGYALTVEGEIRMLRAIRALDRIGPVRLVPTFCGAHAVPPRFRRRPNDYVRLVVREMIPRVARESLAWFCDVFCEPGYFTVGQSREILEAGRRHGLAPKVHADEFRRSGGARLAIETGAVSADHLGAVSMSDVRALGRSSTMAVLLPGTMYFTNAAAVPPARALIRAGAAVALGSDFNPGSSPFGGLPAVMNLACTKLGMSPAEALSAVTLNAAYACGMARQAGSLDAGKCADFVVWDTEDWRGIAFEAGTSLVRGVIVGGRVAWWAAEPIMGAGRGA